MWATRQPTIAPDLPRVHANGTVGSYAGQPAGTEGWDDRIDDLLAIRALTKDWDGQGADAPPVELVDSALVLALLLRRDGVATPTRIVAGVNGTVIFEWQWDAGNYTEVEVTEPYQADMLLMTPGQPTKYIQLFGSPPV
jgi:hypothetical protein